MEENKNIANVSTVPTQSLMQNLRQIIEQARVHVAATSNYALSLMYWHIGMRINNEVLGNQRAEYGKQIVASVARQLRDEYGSRGFDEKNIRRMMQFAQMFPDIQIVSPLVSKLSWSHFPLFKFEVIPNFFHAVSGKSSEEQIVNTRVHNLEWSHVRRGLSVTFGL